jgi:hypothetical protein
VLYFGLPLACGFSPPPMGKPTFDLIASFYPPCSNIVQSLTVTLLIRRINSAIEHSTNRTLRSAERFWKNITFVSERRQFGSDLDRFVSIWNHPIF